jgi:hypothetical protein
MLMARRLPPAHTYAFIAASTIPRAGPPLYWGGGGYAA